MEHQEQLTKLIERALEHGWDKKCSDEINGIIDWVLDGAEIDQRDKCYLLFGDNLSFLKALLTVDQVKAWDGSSPEYLELHPDWEARARRRYANQIVVTLARQPDAKRIPWLYQQVFEAP